MAVPYHAVLAVVTNVALPLLARRFIDATVAATIPVVVWLLTVLLLSRPRPEGDVLLPGRKRHPGVGVLRSLLVGGTAGAITIALTARRSRPGPPAQSEVTTPTRR